LAIRPRPPVNRTTRAGPGVDKRSQDGRTASEILDELRARVVELSARQAGCLRDDLLPALRDKGIRIQSWEECDEEQRRALGERFHRQIFPVLTPLAVGLGRPFPYISNLSLSLAVLLRDPVTDTRTFARVKVPKEMLPRFVPVAEDSTTFVQLEEVIAAHLDALFPGIEILDHGCFRVTRDADFTVSDEADDLLTAVEAELRRRRFGEVVRAEVDGAMSSKGCSTATTSSRSSSCRASPSCATRRGRRSRSRGCATKRGDRST